MKAAGEATEALRQKDVNLQQERQERAQEQVTLDQHFEAVVAQAMQAEGMREKAAAVAAHVAEGRSERARARVARGYHDCRGGPSNQLSGHQAKAKSEEV